MREIYIEYETDGSIYFEIACDGMNLRKMTEKIKEVNKTADYNKKLIMIDYVDQNRYQDSKAKNIVWTHADIKNLNEIRYYK